jgi:hypothetical protein
MAASKTSPSPPLWFWLLKQQRDLKLTGYTPAFLIGASLAAKSKLDKDSAYSELLSLLSSLGRETPTDWHVVVAKCDILHQPVASLYRTEKNKPPCEVVLDGNGNELALYAEDRYFGTQYGDLDSLMRTLLKIFEAPLMSGHYSYYDKDYRAFSADDLRSIATARESAGDEH